MSLSSGGATGTDAPGVFQFNSFLSSHALSRSVGTLENSRGELECESRPSLWDDGWVDRLGATSLSLPDNSGRVSTGAAEGIDDLKLIRSAFRQAACATITKSPITMTVHTV